MLSDTHTRASVKGLNVCVVCVCAAYFSMQVIYARRKYSVTPPITSGPPEFERVFRAQ